MTTDADRQAAEKIVNEFDALELDENEPAMPYIDMLKSAIAQVIADARAVPKDHVRLDTGEVVRVLGTLPMTKDRCLLGEGAIVWRDATASMTGTVRDEILELGWGFYGSGNGCRTKAGGWYSSKEAAESALAARGEK